MSFQEKEGGGTPRAEDVVRLLDVWSRALAELADVGARAGGRRGEALYDSTQAQVCWAGCMQGGVLRLVLWGTTEDGLRNWQMCATRHVSHTSLTAHVIS